MSKIKFCSKNFDNMKSEKKNFFDFKNSLFWHGFQPKFVWFRQQSITIQKCLCLKDHYSSKKIIERISRPCKHTNIVFFECFCNQKRPFMYNLYVFSPQNFNTLKGKITYCKYSILNELFGTSPLMELRRIFQKESARK